MKHPEEWSLTLLVDHDAIYYRLEHDTLEAVEGHAPIGDGERLKAIENAVYETPVLLDDYRATKVIVATSRFALTPAELPETLRKNILRTTLSGVAGDVLTSDTSWGVGLVFELPRGLRSFLDRTFIMPPVVPHLQPLIDYLHGQETLTMLACCPDAEHLDLAIQREGTLQLANTYPCPGTDDALFYILQAAKLTGVDALHDRVMLVGDEEACTRLKARLDEYFKHVSLDPEAPFPLKLEAL